MRPKKYKHPKTCDCCGQYAVEGEIAFICKRCATASAEVAIEVNRRAERVLDTETAKT